MTGRKILIHPGPPKTGSTAIQSFLRESSESGLLVNIVYPLLDKKSSYSQIESGNAAKWGEILRQEISPVFDKELLNLNIDKLLDNSRNSELPILISNEGIWHGDEERLRFFVELLIEKGLDPEWLFVARPFDHFWQSQLSQTLRKGLNSGVSSIQAARIFLRQLKVFNSINIPTRVVAYSKETLITDFLGAIGEEPRLTAEYLNQEINSKLTATEALMISTSIGIFEDTTFVRTLARTLRDGYYRSPEDIRALREAELLGLAEELEIPAELQPKLGAELFTREESTFKGSGLEELFNLVRPSVSSGIDLTIQNTPALIGFMHDIQPSEFEWRMISTALAGVIADKERHIQNIETRHNPSQSINTLGNFQIGPDRKIGFGPNSNLVRTRVGFDPIHYLILNPDVDEAGVDPVSHFETFGSREGRYTRVTKVPKNRKELFAEKPLLFIHTPRTGGTTFRELISTALGEENVYRSHADVSQEGEDSYSDFEKIITDPNFAKSKKAFFGHFPAAVLDEVEIDVISAIFLRNPIKRAISLLQKESRDRGKSVAELFESESFVMRHLDNVQTRILSMNLERSDSSEPITIDAVRFENALKRLESFSFVGITDEFTQSIIRFNGEFGTALEPHSKSVNPSPKLDIDDALLEKLHVLNRYDLALFESTIRRIESSR